MSYPGHAVPATENFSAHVQSDCNQKNSGRNQSRTLACTMTRYLHVLPKIWQKQRPRFKPKVIARAAAVQLKTVTRGRIFRRSPPHSHSFISSLQGGFCTVACQHVVVQRVDIVAALQPMHMLCLREPISGHFVGYREHHRKWNCSVC